MCLLVRGAKATRLYPCVDLSSRDAGVTEELLDHPQIGASLQQMGSERVAQRVRMGIGERGLARRRDP